MTRPFRTLMLVAQLTVVAQPLLAVRPPSFDGSRTHQSEQSPQAGAPPLLAYFALAQDQNQNQDRGQNQDQNKDEGKDQAQKPVHKDQGIDPRSNPPPPPPSPEAAPPKPPDDPGKVAYLAQKDIEVGSFYLHKGDTAAAIDRFHHAAETRPTLSKPWELLGEAYEKMDDKEEALKSYQQYLKIQPGAADAKKIQKKIAKLQSDLK